MISQSTNISCNLSAFWLLLKYKGGIGYANDENRNERRQNPGGEALNKIDVTNIGQQHVLIDLVQTEPLDLDAELILQEPSE